MNFGNRIGDLKQSAQVQVGETTAARIKSVVAAGSVDQPHPDETTLSSASGLLAQSLSISDVRTDKVDALRAALNDGTYQVSSSSVADKLIQSMSQ